MCFYIYERYIYMGVFIYIYERTFTIMISEVRFWMILLFLHFHALLEFRAKIMYLFL